MDSYLALAVLLILVAIAGAVYQAGKKSSSHDVLEDKHKAIGKARRHRNKLRDPAVTKRLRDFFR